MESNKEYIKFFLDLGLNVVPCDPVSKIPMGKWGRWKDEKYTKPIQEDQPICVICGPISNNLVVIDVDSPELIDKIFDDFDTVKEQTVVVQSGNGYHIYAKPDGFMPPTTHMTNNVGQRIDIQCYGAHVVAPPSIHKNGKPYKLISNSNEIKTINIPKFIEELGKFGFDSNGGKKSTREIILGVNEGERDDSAFRLCIAARHFFQDIQPNEMLAILQYWNERNNPPLDQKTLEEKIKSCWGNYDINDAKKYLLKPNERLILYGSKEYKDTRQRIATARGLSVDTLMIYCTDCKMEISAYPYNKYHKNHRIKFEKQ